MNNYIKIYELSTDSTTGSLWDWLHISPWSNDFICSISFLLIQDSFCLFLVNSDDWRISVTLWVILVFLKYLFISHKLCWVLHVKVSVSVISMVVLEIYAMRSAYGLSLRYFQWISHYFIWFGGHFILWGFSLLSWFCCSPIWPVLRFLIDKLFFFILILFFLQVGAKKISK